MKSEFRRFFLNLRREMDEYTIREKSNQIINNLLKSDLYKNSVSIFVYVSKNKEVDTRDFIEKSLANGKKIYVPKIKAKEIFAVKLNNISELEAGSFDIPTSIRSESIENPDLTICPGLSFDDEKNRLGFGGGYYDRFLSQNETTKIGLMIKEFASKKIPTDPWDIKMDYIITEDKIY